MMAVDFAPVLLVFLTALPVTLPVVAAAVPLALVF